MNIISNLLQEENESKTNNIKLMLQNSVSNERVQFRFDILIRGFSERSKNVALIYLSIEFSLESINGTVFE